MGDLQTYRLGRATPACRAPGHESCPARGHSAATQTRALWGFKMSSRIRYGVHFISWRSRGHCLLLGAPMGNQLRPACSEKSKANALLLPCPCCSGRAAVAHCHPGLAGGCSSACCPLWNCLQVKALLARPVLGQLLQQHGFCFSPSSCFNSSPFICFFSDER